MNEPRIITIRGVRCKTTVYDNGSSFLPMVSIEGQTDRWRGFAGGVAKTEKQAWEMFDLIEKRQLLPTDMNGFPNEGV
jgi:hypothetical protein